MKLQGLIFDVDGTLIDSNDLHTHCWIEAFEHFGKHFDYGLVRTQIGKGGDLLVPDLLNAKEMRRFGEKLKRYRTDLYKREYIMKVKSFDFVGDLFEGLHESGVKLALASSSNPGEVEYYTRLLGVERFIEAKTSKKDAKHSKPSPEIFEAALERVGTDPQFTFTVGDTPYDILAAHRSALPIIAVLSGGFARELLTKAEFIFENAGEILDQYEHIDAYLND